MASYPTTSMSRRVRRVQQQCAARLDRQRLLVWQQCRAADALYPDCFTLAADALYSECCTLAADALHADCCTLAAAALYPDCRLATIGRVDMTDKNLAQ